MKTLFDDLIAVYTYRNLVNRDYENSIFKIIHIYLAGILMVNFLVAILSAVFDKMKEGVIFNYKVNLYRYCEKFLISFEDIAYGEMILHSAPVCLGVAPLLLFIGSRVAMEKVSLAFSYL